MNTIEETLSRVPRAEGFLGLALLEAGTGQVLARVAPEGAITDGSPAPAGNGSAGPVPDALATSATDVVRTLAAFVTLHAADEDLQDLVITTTERHHLVRLVPGFAGIGDAFLLLTLDRAHSNLALARHLLLTFEAGLVA